MITQMKASTRVVINTVAQYVRSLILVIVAFWYSRVVLYNLGEIDYGIYSVVGGVIAMIGFIRINLSDTTQRFLSYYIGKCCLEDLRQIFFNSVVTHVLLALIIGLAFFLLSPIVVHELLNIPNEKIGATEVVYNLMIAILCTNLLLIPFFSVIISRENIVFTSIIQVLDGILKVPVAYSLILFSEGRLEWYVWCLFFITFLNLLFYSWYCIKNYEECRIAKTNKFDLVFFREMLSFTGWNMYGTVCMVGRKQGVAVLLNNFLGVTVNTAYSLGNQVATSFENVFNSLITAINPQIVKSESQNQRLRMLRLSEIASKYSTLFMSILTIPFVFYVNDFFELWLKVVPQHSTMFCVFFVIVIHVNLLTISLNTVNNAVGSVKKYNLYVNSIRVLCLPVIFLFLILHYPLFMIMMAYMMSEILLSMARLVFVHHDINYSITQYVRNVLFPVIPIIILNVIIIFLLSRIFSGWLMIISFLFSTIFTLLLLCHWGMKADEKEIAYHIKSIIIKHLGY